MKNAYWAYWLILLGMVIVVIMLLVQNLTTTSTQDYYLIKEITEASLVDAVDYSYYRDYGEIKINKEKFYESFLRRFAETASLCITNPAVPKCRTGRNERVIQPSDSSGFVLQHWNFSKRIGASFQCLI